MTLGAAMEVPPASVHPEDSPEERHLLSRALVEVLEGVELDLRLPILMTFLLRFF